MNLEAQAEYLAYLRRAGEMRQVDGAFAVKTGAFSNTENGVVAHGSVADVASLVGWFGDAPASWLDLDGANHDALLASGARPENAGREMQARVADLHVESPDDVTVLSAGVGEWFDFAATHGWFGEQGERVAFERLYRELVGERFRLTLARVGDTVAGFASAFYGSTFVSLTQVIVDDRFRRRGVATALAAERISRARELGCEIATLGPSPEGAKLYAALGFELLPALPNRWYYLPVA
jgi:GNAT superfamily N-acetyltransferase